MPSIVRLLEAALDNLDERVLGLDRPYLDRGIHLTKPPEIDGEDEDEPEPDEDKSENGKPVSKSKLRRLLRGRKGRRRRGFKRRGKRRRR